LFTSRADASHDDLIAGTTTKAGLKVDAQLDEREYLRIVVPSEQKLAAAKGRTPPIPREWNYNILPQSLAC
jgi:hypothetical protein